MKPQKDTIESYVLSCIDKKSWTTKNHINEMLHYSTSIRDIEKAIHTLRVTFRIPIVSCDYGYKIITDKNVLLAEAKRWRKTAKAFAKSYYDTAKAFEEMGNKNGKLF